MVHTSKNEIKEVEVLKLYVNKNTFRKEIDKF